MKKMINKLIILGILVFIFGLFLASSANAGMYGGTRPPYTYVPFSYETSYDYHNTSMVIPGCEGRNTGFSMTTGQSCIGNNINGSTTNTNTTTKNNTTNTTTNNSNNTTTKTTDNTVSTDTGTNNNQVSTASDINESYGSLTANALVGSNTILPSGFAQWIFLALIIAAIIFLWRYVNAEEKYLSEPLKHA